MRKCIKNEITRLPKIQNKLLNSSNINYINKEREGRKNISAFGTDFKIVLQVYTSMRNRKEKKLFLHLAQILK
jgi:uncharacterized membrane protein YhfC